MSEEENDWNRRYAESGLAPVGESGPLPLFAPFESMFPTEGTALEVACGRGRGAVWLALRGMTVWAVDRSQVAIDLAAQYADLSGVAHRCRFDVHDLDSGLPPGDPVDLVVCHLFREANIDRAMMDRLTPGGMLAVGVLSEVGAGPGRFRAAPGELAAAFAELGTVESGEADGYAWFIGTK